MHRYAEKRAAGALVDHGVIAGGYTNNHVVHFDKLDLDRYPHTGPHEPNFERRKFAVKFTSSPVANFPFHFSVAKASF